MMQNKWRWIPPIVWGILLAVLSLMPTGNSQMFLFHIPNLDKVAHFGMYAVWAYLIVYAWTSNSTYSNQKVKWLTFLFGTLLGVILEYGQYTMTFGRSFETWDIVANSIGSLVGAFFFSFYSPNKGVN